MYQSRRLRCSLKIASCDFLVRCTHAARRFPRVSSGIPISLVLVKPRILLGLPCTAWPLRPEKSAPADFTPARYGSMYQSRRLRCSLKIASCDFWVRCTHAARRFPRVSSGIEFSISEANRKSFVCQIGQKDEHRERRGVPFFQ